MSPEISLHELEQQLSHPEGENGLLVSKEMYKSNAQMIRRSIDTLNLLNNHQILEIGHGNCQHLDQIFKKAVGIQYYGLETSKAMQLEARCINKDWIQNNSVAFLHYNGKQLPFRPESFDRIITVNTIYFWENPIDFLNELSRVLKPDGALVITFAKKDFMQKLPFVKEKFKLYNLLDLKKVLNKTDLSLSDSFSFNETVKSKSNDIVEREYLVNMVKKKSANVITTSLANF